MKGKNDKRKFLKLIYRSFDDDLTEKEQEQLTEALEKSEMLQQIKEETSALRQDVSNSAAQSFEPFFAERVMNRIDSVNKEEYAPDIFYRSLWAVFRPLARYFIFPKRRLKKFCSYHCYKIGEIR